MADSSGRSGAENFTGKPDYAARAAWLRDLTRTRGGYKTSAVAPVRPTGVKPSGNGARLPQPSGSRIGPGGMVAPPGATWGAPIKPGTVGQPGGARPVTADIPFYLRPNSTYAADNPNKVMNDAARYAAYAGQQPTRALLLDKMAAGLVDESMPNYVDDFGGKTLWDALFAPEPGDDGSGGGGGSGRRSGGSGAGGGAGGLAQADVYRQMAAALDAKAQTDLSGFDARTKSVNDLAVSGSKRLDEILAGLGAASGATRADINQSYARTKGDLMGLRERVAAAEAARALAGGNTLAAFGAAPTEFTREYGAQDLVDQSLVGLTGLQGVDDRFMAGKNDVYAGLGADARLQAGNRQDVLLQQLAQARQAAAAQAAAERAQLAMQAAQAGVRL